MTQIEMIQITLKCTLSRVLCVCVGMAHELRTPSPKIEMKGERGTNNNLHPAIAFYVRSNGKSCAHKNV